MKKLKYIGGQFNINLSQLLEEKKHNTIEEIFNLESDNILKTISGRSALASIIDHLDLRDGYVIIPEYTCTTAIYPILERHGLKPLRFEMSSHLIQDVEPIIKLYEILS